MRSGECEGGATAVYVSATYGPTDRVVPAGETEIQGEQVVVVGLRHDGRPASVRITMTVAKPICGSRS